MTTMTIPSEVLLAKLDGLGLPCTLERTVAGPQVTRYELRPTEPTLMSKMRRIGNDLAFELGSYPVTVHAPLPNRAGLIGVEVPHDAALVKLSDLEPVRLPLEIPLGLGIEGQTVYLNIPEGPHFLFAGQTGSGKTSALNTIICGAIERGPEHVGLILIDPKQVEFPRYEGLPHLFTPVADSVEAAMNVLSGTARFVDVRFTAMKAAGVRDIEEMNAQLASAGERPWPRVLVVVDELADLMMASQKSVESLIVRIAQKARAVGIHLLLATQSPRVAVVTGLIKSNVPSRVAFSVTSMTDSRVVLDRNGAELLMGRGDGLLSMSGAHPVRFQSAYVSSEEIAARVERWRT